MSKECPFYREGNCNCPVAIEYKTIQETAVELANKLVSLREQHLHQECAQTGILMDKARGQLGNKMPELPCGIKMDAIQTTKEELQTISLRLYGSITADQISKPLACAIEGNLDQCNVNRGSILKQWVRGIFNLK